MNDQHEKRLIVLLSRYQMSVDNIEEAKRIIESGIDWYKVFIGALNNKIIGLVYYNIIRNNLLCKIKPIIYNLMKYYYLCNAERNKYLIREKYHIIEKLNNDGINVLALKGGYLVEKVYKDWGSRTCNDLDFYCRIEDALGIDKALGEIGYKQGEIDWNTKTIVDMPRLKKIGWKLNMNNIPTYIKKIEDSDYIDFIEIDFSYAFDLRKDVSISESVFKNSRNNQMSKYDAIIYLASHLFKEAENDIWIEAKADLNLIKFCDIREDLRGFDDKEIEQLVERSMELKCEGAMYYCAYYLNIIYEDEMFERILDCFSKHGYELKQTKYDRLDFSKETEMNFWNRIFSYDNSESLLSEDFETKKKILNQRD